MDEQERLTQVLGKATALTPGLPAWKERAGAVGEGLIDLLMGIAGVGPETQPNLVGQLLSAGAPMLGGVKAAQGVKKGIKAYHGSPHDFDKFSLSKIGTGEGAQAYGHGLYFADNESVARNYREALSKGAQWEIDGRLFGSQTSASNASVGTYAADALERFKGDKDAAIEWLKDGGPDSVEAAELLRRSTSIKPTQGRMYEVNINADPEDFLDWDAPIKDQPAILEKVRRTVLPSQLETFDNNVNSGIAGANAYRNYVGGSDVGASQVLRDYAGIPGIKYLDGASRSAGQGSRNYVVFDDALIEIKRKYGFMLPIMGAAGFEQWTRQKAAEQTGVNPMDVLAERKW